MNVLILEDNAGRIAVFKQMYPQAAIVTTAKEAIGHLSGGKKWDLVSLDHDLNGEIFVDSGRDDCGMEVARHIVKTTPPIKKLIIHTANEGAAKSMAVLLGQYKPRLQPFEGVYDSRSYLHADKYPAGNMSFDEE